jgi:DNA-directed RNA polymerase specialized sigma24 family protein
MYYPRIKSYIASRVNSDADIEDLAHDVIVQLYTGKSHYDGSSDVESYRGGCVVEMFFRLCAHKGG